MNYFALAGAILFGVLALRSIVLIVAVMIGSMRYADPTWGFPLNALLVAASAPLAAWLYSVAIG